MAGTVEDMTTLSELSEEAIMENLQKRYELRLIYTYTGSILVAMNPFEKMDIYNMPTLKHYMGKRHNENPPHIFAIAEAAYSNVRNRKVNQSVIISGESGAGKSESTKVILQYLTTVTSKENQESWVEQQILEANTVLESFGNAKTVRNNNSSRFGKFIQVNFNRNSQIVGASIINYLLEKSRIAKQAPDERNYHIFYELVAGVNDEEREKYQLDSAESYYFLNQSGCVDIPYVDDSKNFSDLKLALTVLKMTPADQESLFRALSAILAIGNIDFSEDGSTETVSVAEAVAVDKVAELLQIDAKQLTQCLLFRKLVIRGETSLVPYKLQQAKDTRDSFAKGIYDNLFQRLVEFINKSLTSKEKPANFVGVLDIFGFEVFKINSFEQFCINYTNEKLQSFFNQFIFKLEQEEYDKEGIKWDKIDFKDNQQCLDLIEAKPAGILSLLDEETKFPKGTDDSWLAKLDNAHAKQPFYIKARTQKGVFGVRHYAGDVNYTVSSFLDKNRDQIQEELLDIMRSSKVPYISKIFPKEEKEEQAGKGPRGGKTTASTAFKTQLTSLVTTLGATTPHYVRCIKPNQEKEAFLFSVEMVLSQLRYSGMLDTIRIRKAGYAMRLPYDGFVRDFKCLIPEGLTYMKDDPKKISPAIAQKADLPAGSWQAGKTKFFIKQDAFAALQDRAKEVLKAKVVLIQKVLLGNLYRQKYLRMQKSARFLETFVLGFVYRRRYKRTTRSIVKIQATARGWFARDYYKKVLAEKKAEERAAAKARQTTEQAPVQGEELTSAEARTSIPTGATQQLPLPKKEKEVTEPKAAPKAKIATQGKASQQTEEGVSPASAVPASAVVKKQGRDIDNLFAFLGDFDTGKTSGTFRGADLLAEMAAAITAEIDAMFDEPIANAKAAISKPEQPSSGAAVIEKSPSVPLPAMQQKVDSDASLPAPMVTTTSGASVLLSHASSRSLEDRNDTEDIATGKLMKHNPIMKEVERSQDSLDKFDINSKDVTMETYALKHFEQHLKSGGFATIAKKKAFVPMQEMLSYSKVPIAGSITKIPHKNEALDEAAVEAFKTLLRASEVGGKRSEEAIQAYLHIGIHTPELRDEIFVQLVKQVTEPKEGGVPKQWDQLQLNTWQILTLAAATFPPSKILAKFLLAFLKRTAASLQESSPIKKLNVAAEQALRRTLLNGSRKNAPSLLEITTLKSGGVLPCRFSLLDGREMDIPVGLTTIAGDIVKEIAKKIDLKDPSGWSLYEINPRSERAIKASDYVSDTLAAWEKDKDPKKKDQSATLKKGKKGESPALGVATNLDASLVLKKRVFRDVTEEIVDGVEYNLLYAQAVDGVIKDMYPMTELVAMHLAALRAQILLGDCDPRAAETRLVNELNSWIVARLIPNQPREAWVSGIVKHYLKLHGTSPDSAKSQYLQTVRSLKHYGAGLFSVKHKGMWAFSEEIAIAVHSTGIDYLQSRTHETLSSFPYKDLKSYEHENGLLTLMAVTPNEDAAFEATEVYQFFTSQAEEIVMLIREYCPTTEYTKKVKEQVQDVDIKKLHRDVDKCRLALLEHNIMRRPGPEGGVKKKQGGIRRLFTTTTKGKPQVQAVAAESPSMQRRLSSSSMKSTRSEMNKDSPSSDESVKGIGVAGEEAYADDYGLADFSFSSKVLVSSLMALADPDFPTWAAETSLVLSEFAGLQGAPPPELSEWPIQALQGVIDKCLDSPYLINELYLQLIKQTTNHPEPDSLSVLNMWRVLTVVAGALAPTGWILEYAKAHLRLYSAVDPRTRKARTQEAQHARHCLRTLHKTIPAAPRKFPPSTDEIMQTAKLVPLRIRFHLLDGQTIAVPVEPSDTGDAIYHALLEKLKLPSLTGFAIYERFGVFERAIAPEDKITDSLSRWEKYTKQERTMDRVSFVLKRRLFLHPKQDSTSAAENKLVRAQALTDIGRDLFPVSEDDIVVLVALWAQVQHGDVSYDRPVNYDNLCSAYIPKRLNTPGTGKKVAEKHMEYLGTTSAQAQAEISQILRAWPLYGCTIFNVEQNTNKSMPSACWLAVGVGNIHILAQHQKTPLFTYSYQDIVSYSPSLNSILLIIGNNATGQKYIFNTVQSHEIAELIKEYVRNSQPKERFAGPGSRLDLRGSHTMLSM